MKIGEAASEFNWNIFCSNNWLCDIEKLLSAALQFWYEFEAVLWGKQPKGPIPVTNIFLIPKLFSLFTFDISWLITDLENPSSPWLTRFVVIKEIGLMIEYIPTFNNFIFILNYIEIYKFLSLVIILILAYNFQPT